MNYRILFKKKYEEGSFSLITKYYDIYPTLKSENSEYEIYLNSGTFEGADFSKAYIRFGKKNKKEIKLSNLEINLYFRSKDCRCHLLNLNKTKFENLSSIDISHPGIHLSLEKASFSKVHKLNINTESLKEFSDYEVNGTSCFFNDINHLTIIGKYVNSVCSENFNSCKSDFSHSTLINIPNLKVNKISLRESTLFKVAIRNEHNNGNKFTYIDLRDSTLVSSALEGQSFSEVLVSPKTTLLNCMLNKTKFYKEFEPIIKNEGIKQLIDYINYNPITASKTMKREFEIQT